MPTTTMRGLGRRCDNAYFTGISKHVFKLTTCEFTAAAPSDRAAPASHPPTSDRATSSRVAAERFERLSGEEREQLADRLQDAAMRHFHRMHALNQVARRVRGER